jgi:glycosyltransferase involved in cell wall biosynthesis
MKQVAVASHVALIQGKEYDGIGHVVIETLSSITTDFTFVRHSMDGHLHSEVQKYHKGKVTQSYKLKVSRSPAPLRYLTEVIKTVYHFTRKEKVNVYIGIDPLNAVSGIILRKLGRVDTAIFYTADYSTSRFSSRLLNAIYHWIDTYCVRNADEVWSVSSRIVEIRKSMGLSDDKNIFLPNVPPKDYDKYQQNKHTPHTLITSGIIDKQLDFKGIFEAIKVLKAKYADIRLEVAGNGPQEKVLKTLAKRLGIDDEIVFLGRIPLGDLMDRVSRAGVGLALYTGVWGFNVYGDSTKCREYFNFGLPVLSTDTHSTVQDIKSYRAGIVTNMSADEYVAALEDIFTHYEKYSNASRKLGEKHSGSHLRHLSRILQ